MRIILVMLALVSVAVAGDLPNAPSATPRHPEEVSRKIVVDQTGPRFFEFRKSWQDPPLATNKQVFKSKAFLAQLCFMFAAEELARTRTHSESEPWAAAGVAGFSYIGYRFFSPSFSLGMTASGANWLKEWAQAK